MGRILKNSGLHKAIVFVSVVAVVLALAGQEAGAAPGGIPGKPTKPTPTTTATPTPTPLVGATPTPTPVPSATATPTPTATPSPIGAGSYAFPNLPVGTSSFDYNQDVDNYWAPHPFNPDNPSSIPIGSITPPTGLPVVNLTGGQSIQAAIDSCPATGCVINLAAGTYTSGFSLVGKSNIYFLGSTGAVIRGGATNHIATTSLALNYDNFTQCVYYPTNSNHASCINSILNRSGKLYFKNITFDGAGAAVIGIHVADINGVVFDNAVFQNFYDPQTGIDGPISGHAYADNVWCRGCRFVGNGRWAEYLDGMHGGGMVKSQFDSNFLNGGLLYPTNDDFRTDIDRNGILDPWETRMTSYVVAYGNTFGSGFYTWAAMTARSSLFKNNSSSGYVWGYVFDDSGKDILYTDWPPAHFYSNKFTGNRVGDAPYLLRLKNDFGNYTGNNSILYYLGRYTLGNNTITGPTSFFKGQLALTSGNIDGPNTSCGNYVSGMAFDNACSSMSNTAPTPTPTTSSTPTPTPSTGTFSTTSSAKLYYGIEADQGFFSGSSTFRSLIQTWKSRGLDSVLAMNNVPDLSVSDAEGFNVIAAPLYDLYRQWFYYEQYNNGAPLCGGNVSIDCARQIIGPIVDGIKSHPSVGGYYTLDDAHPSLNQRIQLATQVFKEHDTVKPNSPGLIQQGTGEGVFAAAQPNVFTTYDYPAKNGYAPCDFYADSVSQDWVQRTRETIQQKPLSTPLWEILQTHGSSTGYLRTPTVEEVRLQNWLALGEDAKGIYWFSWFTEAFWTGLADNPTLLNEVTNLAGRVNKLRPYLSTIRKVSDKFQVSGSGKAYASTLQDLSTGAFYVIAANQECSAQNLSLSSLYYNAQLRDLESGAVYNLGAPIPFDGGDGHLYQVVNGSALTPPAVQANLVQNPGFELDSNNDAIPDIWTAASGAVRDATVRHSGNASLKVTGPTAAVTVQDIGLRPNTRYYVSWYQKGQSLTQSHLGIQYYQLGSSSKYLDSVLWDENGSYDWQKRVAFFTTPGDYTRGQILIGWDTKAGGVYWIDDVQMCEDGKPCADGYLSEHG